MNNNPNKYDKISIQVTQVFVTILICLLIAITVKFCIEIHNVIEYSKEVDNLKVKANNMQEEYKEIHNKVEKELKYEY